MTNPIKPSDIKDIKSSNIPEEVIKVFNDLIIKSFSGNRAVVYQDEAVKLSTELMGITAGQLYNNNWLDVESIFENNGWEVEYDKPHYSESYRAHFIFKPKQCG